MLKYLRFRRRRPSGAYLCAAISSLLLLLLSVSLLYTRLSRSLPRPHLHHTPFHDFDSARSEDKIDELDVVDEDQQQHQEYAASRFDDNQVKVYASGYFFDQVTGSIRRAFNKRSIEEWDDERVGFLVGSGVEDRSKTAFASDDLPVDGEVRRKASQAMGVEDALLLKIGKRVSPLREGWGDWFDKKGEFLKKNKMFKSDWPVLDQMNNMILLDPASFGVGKLTEDDQIVRNWWMSEFNRTPFLGEKTLEISRVASGGDDSELQENGDEVVNYNAKSCKCKRGSESRSENKGTERRTLNDNARNGADNVGSGAKLSDGVDNVFDESVDNGRDLVSEEHGNSVDNGELHRSTGSGIQRGPEFLNHLYADGKRWGYYPGLPPHLAFTQFMDAFFRMGKCDTRVFMVWNSPPWMYGVRHQRGLESLLFHHRDACVVVFSETIELDFFKDKFVNDGYKVAVVMPNLDELLKDTPTHIFSSVWFEWRKTKFYSTHYSELIRLAALYKYGGIYLDSDIIVLKPISSLNNSVGMENNVAGSALNGAVMAFRRHSLFIKECLKEFYMTYDDTSLRWNGADLLTRVVKIFLRDKNENAKLELKVEPAETFFPISSQNITRYFMEPETETEKAQQDILFEKLLRKSLTFHFWNSLTSTLIPEPESLVTRLINRSCIQCSELL